MRRRKPSREPIGSVSDSNVSRDKKKNARDRLRKQLSERPQGKPKLRKPMVMKMAKLSRTMDTSRSK